MSLEQCQAMAVFADALKVRLREACGRFVDISRPIGRTPDLSTWIDETIALLATDPRDCTQQPIARSTERRPPPYFSRVSFHAPAPATPISDDELDCLPHDDDFRRMSTMPPAEMAAETFPSDRVAEEILGGVPG